MNIRTKLISLFVALLAILLVIQAFLYYQYTDKVSENLGQAAFQVSKQTASVFIYNQDAFYESKKLTLEPESSQPGQIIFKPIHKDIQIRLGDNLRDEEIKVISPDKEFTIDIPRTKVQATINELKSRNLWLTFVLFSLAIVVIIVLTYSITKPLMALNQAAKAVGRGKFGTQVKFNDKNYGDDIKATIEQFNKMSSDLVSLSQQQDQKRELEHFKELSDISRGLAHNLRNPLNTLQLSLDQLDNREKHGDDQSQRNQLTEVAKVQVQRIEHWLKSFTLLMEQGIDKSFQKVKHLLEQALEQIDYRNFTLNGDESIQIACVETEMVMILHILLQNAVDSSLQMTQKQPEESSSLPIDVSYLHNKSHILISIADQGLGLDTKLKQRLFKPYTTNKTYGTGMGLYIAQRLMRHRYQANIELTTNEPQGCIATIKIPYNAEDQLKVQDKHL
ncbi:HAMP domain-containing sensor histidine kinase [Kangiella sp. TOML190]|uniref:sensor histidine kinase n=1 Tax=Kangiella sp. TOML190 TaxID=2931351 RepID=UPI002041075C|nr:HAMP domain-containing sensor histidine kinase [Kangiella sp. TOML190]